MTGPRQSRGKRMNRAQANPFVPARASGEPDTPPKEIPAFAGMNGKGERDPEKLADFADDIMHQAYKHNRTMNAIDAVLERDPSGLNRSRSNSLCFFA